MSSPHYAVLGGGISGLAAAYQLRRKCPDAKITLLEKSHRLGGWIETRNTNGFLCEMGPRSLRAGGKGVHTLRLVEELGLQDEVVQADPAAKIRYIYENGRLRALPHGAASLAFSSFLPLLAKAIYKDLRVRPVNREDESIFCFAERHFGQEVAERLIDPLTLGIYATDCRELSVSACFPLWAEQECSHGSLLRAAFAKKKQEAPESAWICTMQKGSIFSFKKGMETLVQALSQRLDGHVRLNSAVEKLDFRPEGIEIRLDDGQTIFADHVYSTLPASSLQRLLPIEALQIPTASVAVVCIGFNKAVLNRKGFGYLIPSKEKESILGMVWDSSAFPDQNFSPEQTRLTVMIDAKQPQDFSKTALDALERHLGIAQTPHLMEMKVADNAIPQYRVGHLQRMKEIQDRCQSLSPRLTLLGTAFHGVSVNDCIAQASSLNLPSGS